MAVIAKLHDPAEYPWEEIKDQIIAIEHEEWPETAVPDDVLERGFIGESRVSTVILIDTETQKIIGFTYAVPNEKGKEDTADIWDTVILKSYRGQKLVGSMMKLLEDDLRKNGYIYLERSAMIANNYAENVQKNYQDRIIESHPTDSIWGPQIFFRIKL